MRCEEAQELITALVDKQLPGSERASIEGHLKDCSRCQLIYSQELELKREVRKAGAGLGAPAELREKILHDPRVFAQKPTRSIGPARDARLYLRPALALALLILLVLPVLYMMRPAGRPISLTAFETHEKIVSGELPIIRAGSPEEIKEMLYHSVDDKFAPMTYDLSMMNLKAVGGTVREFGGRKVLVTVYEGEGISVTCYTFLGTERDAPPGAEIFFAAEKTTNFYTYSRAGINAVFHREGKLICILVSKLPLPELLTLARSNAQPTPPAQPPA